MEERSISCQRDPKVFSGHVISFGPLSLQHRAFTREHVGQPSHYLGHQRISLFYGGTRLIHEAGLDRLPPRPISNQFVVRKEVHLPPFAGPVVDGGSVGILDARGISSAGDVRMTICASRAIVPSLIDIPLIDSARTVDSSATVVGHGSLDRSLDRIRHEGVVVRGSPIGRALHGSLNRVGYHGVIAILS